MEQKSAWHYSSEVFFGSEINETSLTNPLNTYYSRELYCTVTRANRKPEWFPADRWKYVISDFGLEGDFMKEYFFQRPSIITAMLVLALTLVFSNSGCVSTASIPDPFASSTLVRGASLEIKLDWLEINVIPNSKYKLNNTYIIEIDSNESVLPRRLEFNGLDDVIIVLRGKKTNRTISLSVDDAMFEILSGVTLVLDSNITLLGRPGNLAPLIHISNGTLIMERGSSITGNTYNNFGGGVYLSDNGTFIMVNVPII